MALFSPVQITETAEGSPPTQSLFSRIRDNPLAVYTKESTVLISPVGIASVYIVPKNITQIFVLMIGGGAGGGSGDGVTTGGGGGSGAVSYGVISVFGGDSIGYTIGAGGDSGVGGGSTSFFGIDTGTSPQGAVGVGGKSDFVYNVDGSDAELESRTYPAIQHGLRGASGTNEGGAGAPCGIPIPMFTEILGKGGDGGKQFINDGVGGSASEYGAGGGGGYLNKVGGAGSNGCIFIQPLE